MLFLFFNLIKTNRDENLFDVCFCELISYLIACVVLDTAEESRCAEVLSSSVALPLAERPKDSLYCESPQHVDLVIIFLAVLYLFFTNIILLNVLIAMFTSVTTTFFLLSLSLLA